ncbi:MAG: UDP-N-acetylglucosamine 2-epimerase [bacterium]|nr:UDP-N-acetylglucosamine 2-epimerase [bacterium]
MSVKKRKICVVTNTRADYSRLRTLLLALKKHKDVDLVLCVAGSHLLSHYGYTIKEIERDGFAVAYRIYSEVDGRVLSTMTKSTGLAIIEFSSFFENNRPDIVVVHGDRFEAFAAATAASMMNIHVAHLQGGDITGTIDEHLRHAISKLSHFHFPTNDKSAKRLCQLGEDPQHVFSFGCPSVDSILATPTYSFQKFKKQLALQTKKKEWLQRFNEDFILLVQHPVTTEVDSAAKEIVVVLDALRSFDRSILMLWPNIDAGSEKMVSAIKQFESKTNGLLGVFDNFSVELFHNIMKHTSVIVGNSSAGIVEACYFGIPVVNIGSRQQGRLRTENIVDVACDKKAIKEAVKVQLSSTYACSFPYGKKNVGKKIAEKLATIPLPHSQKRLRELPIR